MSSWALGVDPGHGGPDRGACGERLEEASLVLDLAHRVAAGVVYLYPDVAPVLLRQDDDRDPTMSVRCAAAKAAACELVVSLHADASPHLFQRGARVLYWPGNPRTHTLATSVSLAMPPALRHFGHPWPAHQAHYPRARAILGAYEADAIVVECGFLDCPQNERDLERDTVRDAVALAVIAAVAAHRIERARQ